MSQPTAFDLVVVGAGLIGRSVADEASRRGLRVLVVSRSRTGSASPAAGGMLTPAAEAETAEPALLELARKSCQLYPDWVARLEAETGRPCGYRRNGTVLLALHRDHWADLEHLAAAQEAVGLATETLSPQDVLALEPNLTPRQVGARYARHDHSVDPRALLEALAAALDAKGVTRWDEADVVDVSRRGGEVTGLAVQRGQTVTNVSAAAVVVACGAWSPTAFPELAALALRPVKGQFVLLQGEPLLERVVRTPDVYLIPRADGQLYIGATSEEVGFDANVTAGAVMDLLGHAWRTLPGTYEATVVETGIGFRPTLRDHLPAIGASQTQGLFVATGHYRHGVMLAPVTAARVVDLITGAVTCIEPEFDPQRFATVESATV